MLATFQLFPPNMANIQSPVLTAGSGSLTDAQGLTAQLTYLKNLIQKSVVDGRSSTDDSVGKEEGTEGSEHSVGHGNGAVDCQVKFDI